MVKFFGIVLVKVLFFIFVMMLPTSFFRRSIFRVFVFVVLLTLGVCNRGFAENTASIGRVKSQVASALVEKKVGDRLRKLVELGSGLALSEITEALEVAQRLDELRARAVLRESAVKRWSQLAPAAAWAYVATLPEGRSKLDLVRIVAPAFAKNDLVHAAAVVTTMAGSRSRIEAVGIIAEVWARSDVAASLQWARGLSAGPAQETALYNIRFIWVHSDPAAASEDVRHLPPGDTKNALTMNIAGEWAARDPQQAIAWARALPDAAEQELAFSNIVESWADASPRQAGEFAMQLPAQFRQRALIAVVARWATQDPSAAAACALQVPDAVVQGRGLAEVFTVWASVDPDAARNWVNALEPAPCREAAVQAYVEAVAEWAPEAAARMALEISDPAVRWQRVERCVTPWYELDAAPARRWFEAADLPAENKRQWLSAHGNN